MKIESRSSPTRWCIALVCAGLAAGCQLDDEPLPPGRYAYVASHPTPEGSDTIRLEGVLEISGGQGDSIRGRWDVPQLHPELRVLSTEGGVLVVTGHPTYFGTLVHRMSRRSGGPSCRGEYTWVDDGGAERAVSARCSISRVRD